MSLQQTNEVTITKETPLARSLTILVPLIKEDISQANEAAETASLPYRIAAGYKLAEAKSRHWKKIETRTKKGKTGSAWAIDPEYWAWVRRNFNISSSAANEWINLARNNSEEWPWPEPTGLGRGRQRRSGPQTTEGTGKSEKKILAKMGQELISVGYRELSKKYHKDAGGSDINMVRLNKVRDAMKAFVKNGDFNAA